MRLTLIQVLVVVLVLVLALGLIVVLTGVLVREGQMKESVLCIRRSLARRFTQLRLKRMQLPKRSALFFSRTTARFAWSVETLPHVVAPLSYWRRVQPEHILALLLFARTTSPQLFHRLFNINDYDYDHDDDHKNVHT